MKNKGTAVEWLEENLIGNPHFESDFIHNRNMFKQAKAMEKEQIMNAYSQGLFGEEATDSISAYAKQYYNETYNQ